jgi:hypothetical protein
MLGFISSTRPARYQAFHTRISLFTALSLSHPTYLPPLDQSASGQLVYKYNYCFSSIVRIMRYPPRLPELANPGQRCFYHVNIEYRAIRFMAVGWNTM